MEVVAVDWQINTKITATASLFAKMSSRAARLIDHSGHAAGSGGERGVNHPALHKVMLGCRRPRPTLGREG